MGILQHRGFRVKGAADQRTGWPVFTCPAIVRLALSIALGLNRPGARLGSAVPRSATPTPATPQLPGCREAHDFVDRYFRHAKLINAAVVKPGNRPRSSRAKVMNVLGSQALRPRSLRTSFHRGLFRLALCGNSDQTCAAAPSPYTQLERDESSTPLAHL